MDLLYWLMGFTGLGAVGLVALAIFAPSVLSVVAEYLKALSPLVKGFAELVVKAVKVMWDGIKDVFDNLNTIIFVGTILVLAYLYGWARGEEIVIDGCKPQTRVETRTKYKYRYKSEPRPKTFEEDIIEKFKNPLSVFN